MRAAIRAIPQRATWDRQFRVSSLTLSQVSHYNRQSGDLVHQQRSTWHRDQPIIHIQAWKTLSLGLLAAAYLYGELQPIDMEEDEVKEAHQLGEVLIA